MDSSVSQFQRLVTREVVWLSPQLSLNIVRRTKSLQRFADRRRCHGVIISGFKVSSHAIIVGGSGRLDYWFHGCLSTTKYQQVEALGREPHTSLWVQILQTDCTARTYPDSNLLVKSKPSKHLRVEQSIESCVSLWTGRWTVVGLPKRYSRTCSVDLMMESRSVGENEEHVSHRHQLTSGWRREKRSFTLPYRQ